MVVLVASATNMQRQAEQKIKQQNDFLNLVLDSLKYPFIVIDPSNYTITLANSAARSSQLTKESTCYALTHERDEPCNSVEHPCPIEIIKKTKKPITLEHIHYDKDGNSIHVEVHAFPVLDSNGNVFQVIEYSNDITERKRKDELLRESEERYRVFFEASTLGIIITDIGMGLFIDANSSFCRMFGYSKGELLQLGIEDIHPKDSLDHLITDTKSQERGEHPISHSIPCLRKDGTVFYADIVGANTIIHERRCIVSFFMDITERKRAEEELRKSENKYRTLLETTSEGCWLLNLERKTIEVNTTLCKMLGYNQDEMIGKKPIDFVDDENRKIFIEQTSKISATPHRSYEITLIKKNGEDLNTYFNATTIRDESGEALGSFAFITDITERKQTEEQRNKLIAELQKALSEVKTLRGFLPICSHCKNIRDDKGYWNQIESYIHKHSDTEFSHGICPECAKKYYPDMDIYDDNGEVTEDNTS